METGGWDGSAELSAVADEDRTGCIGCIGCIGCKTCGGPEVAEARGSASG